MHPFEHLQPFSPLRRRKRAAWGRTGDRLAPGGGLAPSHAPSRAKFKRSHSRSQNRRHKFGDQEATVRRSNEKFGVQKEERTRVRIRRRGRPPASAESACAGLAGSLCWAASAWLLCCGESRRHHRSGLAAASAWASASREAGSG